MDSAFRGKNEHLIGKEIYLQAFHEILRVRHVLLPVQDGPEPFHFLVKDVRLSAFLVSPMGRDAVFGDFVHFFRPDLDLDGISSIPYDRGMQRLVSVQFWHCYVIREASGYRAPCRVHKAQDSVTIFYGINYDPDREKVVQVLELKVLADHLPVNAVKMFGSAEDLRLYVHL